MKTFRSLQNITWSVLRIGLITSLFVLGASWAYRYFLTTGARRVEVENIRLQFVPPENALNPRKITLEDDSEPGEYVYFPWREEEYNFLSKATRFGLEAVRSPSVTECIAREARTFPVVYALPDTRETWREKLAYFTSVLHFGVADSPYQDLYNIQDRPHTVVLYKMKQTTPNRNIATAGTSRLGVVLRERGVDMPLPIYLTAHYLRAALEADEYRDYGATLIHEILHHYNHDHPDGSRAPELFIRAATTCVASYREAS